MYDQRIDALVFPEVTTGIESLKNFYHAFWSSISTTHINTKFC